MKKYWKLDWVITVSVILLLSISLLMLYSMAPDKSASMVNFKKQLFSAALGVFLMVVVSFYDYRMLVRYSSKFYFAIVVLLSAVIFFGTTVRGHTGWLGIGSYRFQPVEIAKIILIIFLAGFFSQKKNQLGIVVRIIASTVLIFIPLFLILRQPDFGSSIIIIGIWGIMLSVSGVNKKNLAALAILGVITCGTTWFFLKSYQKDRIMNFIEPDRDPQGSGYNAIQAMVAVGSGSVFGKGLGHGSQSQLNFLPEKHTDFIFAVISEELGFLGASFLLVVLTVLLYRIKETAKKARDNFGYLLAVGVLAMIFLQTFVNIGMNIGIVPITGVPLPLVSYGGSSLVVVLVSLGIVQGVYARRIKSNDSARNHSEVFIED